MNKIYLHKFFLLNLMKIFPNSKKPVKNILDRWDITIDELTEVIDNNPRVI